MTKKDKSLILFILSATIIIWFSFSLLSSLVSKTFFYNSNSYKLITDNGENPEWLNVSEPLKASNLEDRVILLDFWTYACVNCMHMIPEIKKLEEEFGSKLTVIGVHSGKFDNEKNVEGIRNAIVKYDISHPVVNDSKFNIWNNFKVKSWPTLILIGPNGQIKGTYVGEGTSQQIREDVTKLVKKYRYSLNRDPLPIVPEKNKIVGHVLSFPSKLEYVKDFESKGIAKTPAILISNSGKNTIIVSSLSGDILLEIGSGKKGLTDGTIGSASFNNPHGLLYKNSVIYVADTGNHALRKIDLKKNEVSTIAGSGARGQILLESKTAKESDLASPWDLEFFPDKNNIIIANSGTHQLLKYDITKEAISPFAGNGVEGIIDGSYPKNNLAQPSAINIFSEKLYFIDSETSSLRVADKNGLVKTLIGSDLFKFGHKNGPAKEALMQHPVGLAVDDTGIYIADTHNSIIRKYDVSQATISDYSGSGKKNSDIGSNLKNVSYNEPEDIVAVLDKFYIADTNNNRILVINRNSGDVSVLDVMPPLKLQKQGMLEYLPNLNNLPDKTVKSDVNISLLMRLPDGWKINEEGPSFINLLEISKNEAILIASYDWNSVKTGEIKLPKLDDGKNYYLQGTIYYCQNKRGSICLINSYGQKLIVKKSVSDDQIKIEFITDSKEYNK